MSLSQRIRRLLKGTGATYAAVARGLKCSPARIGHLATGEHASSSGDFLARLAVYFDVDLVWLASGKGVAPTAEHLRAVAASKGFTRRGQPTVRPSDEAAA
jgi:transcriptional regulator with XRE-family HTH domain